MAGAYEGRVISFYVTQKRRVTKNLGMSLGGHMFLCAFLFTQLEKLFISLDSRITF